jgi:hypothetical protein
MSTRIGVGLTGALGLFAVVRTAQYYAGVDRFAFSIALVMGVVLCGGLLELLWIAARTTRLQRELDAFPADAGQARIESASPLLRALLSARLDRTALPVPGAVFAPYLLSLLVMLGLLGTFLGLFETLRGASQALDASADVEALRGGLRAPIGGLMRAFGTSAAGVASSAMLGLAAVLVRRDASRFSVALHSVASGTLAHYAPAHRQLVALETLAEQGRAWPTAAAALTEAVAQLRTLEHSWKQAHAEAASDQQRQLARASEQLSAALERGIERHAAAAAQTQQQLGQASTEIREAIGRGVERAAQVSREAVSPLLAQAVAEHGAAVREHLGGVREELRLAGVELTRELTSSADAVRAQLDRGREADARQEGRAEALLARLTEASGVIASAAQAQTDALGDFVSASEERQRESESAREQRLGELLGTWQALARQQADGLAALEHNSEQRQQQAEASRAQQLSQLLESWQNLAREQAERLGSAEQSSEQRQQRAEASRSQQLSQLLDSWQNLAREQAERLGSAEQASEQRQQQAEASRTQQLSQLLDSWQSLAREQAERLGSAEQASEQRQQQAEAGRAQQLSQLLEAWQSLAREQAERLAALESSSDARQQQAEAGRTEQLVQLLAAWQTQAAQQAERLAAFEARLAEQQATHAESLAGRLHAHVAALQGPLGHAADLLEEASRRIQGGGLELQAVAESFSKAVASQREGARQWLESLGDIERYALEAGESAAADALGQHLARTHEVFDRQLKFQEELLEQLSLLGHRQTAVAPRADASA